MAKENNICYEERITAFIDIMGFSDYVENADCEAVYSLVNKASKVEELVRNSKSHGDDLGVEVTCFSDSIVISVGIKRKEAFSNLLTMVHVLIERLVEQSVAFRGGITIGKLYHNANMVFGPAMVDAYNLESKSAVSPRIIMKQEVLEKIESTIDDSFYRSNSYLNKIFNIDGDRFLYFDYFKLFNSNGISYKDDRALYLKQLYRIISIGLMHPEISVRMKYYWMANKFNNLIDLDMFNVPKLFLS